MGGLYTSSSHIRIPLPLKPLQSFQREKLGNIRSTFDFDRLLFILGNLEPDIILKVFSFINVVAMRNHDLARGVKVPTPVSQWVSE